MWIVWITVVTAWDLEFFVVKYVESKGTNIGIGGICSPDVDWGLSFTGTQKPAGSNMWPVLWALKFNIKERNMLIVMYITKNELSNVYILQFFKKWVERKNDGKPVIWIYNLRWIICFKISKMQLYLYVEQLHFKSKIFVKHNFFKSILVLFFIYLN